MILWPISLGLYLAIGLVFVFFGPAARRRRRERSMLEFFDQPPRWKLLAVSASMTVRIIVLWPVLVVSAARIKSGVTLQMSELSDHASPKLDQLISEARNQYCDFMLPLETFRELEAKIPWTDREHFESQLSELGFMITGFVKNCEGQDVPAAIWVVQTVGIPFALSTVQDGCDLSRHEEARRSGMGILVVRT